MNQAGSNGLVRLLPTNLAYGHLKLHFDDLCRAQLIIGQNSEVYLSVIG